MLCAGGLPLHAQSKEKKEDQTLTLLRKFADKLPTMKVDEFLAATKELSKKIPDEQLPKVETFGLSRDAKGMRFAFVPLLVDRGKYDSAARLIIKDLDESGKDREYMWKWWETMFGERKEYKELSHQFGEARLRQFDHGDDKTRLIVAEIFGKGEAETKMSLDDFKKAINYKDNATGN